MRTSLDPGLHWTNVFIHHQNHKKKLKQKKKNKKTVVPYAYKFRSCICIFLRFVWTSMNIIECKLKINSVYAKHWRTSMKINEQQYTRIKPCDATCSCTSMNINECKMKINSVYVKHWRTSMKINEQQYTRIKRCEATASHRFSRRNARIAFGLQVRNVVLLRQPRDNENQKVV